MKDLEGKVIINGTDIWKEYGVFLTEEKKGGRENLTAIMAPAKAKTHVGVNIREHDGVKYSADLNPKSEESVMSPYTSHCSPLPRNSGCHATAHS